MISKRFKRIHASKEKKKGRMINKFLNITTQLQVLESEIKTDFNTEKKEKAKELDQEVTAGVED